MKPRQQNPASESNYTKLDACDSQLTMNTIPIEVAYSQIFTFRKDEGANSPELIYNAFSKYAQMGLKERKLISEQMAEEVRSRNPVINLLEEGDMPDPDKKEEVNKKRIYLTKAGFLKLKQDLDDNKIHGIYKKVVSQEISAANRKNYNDISPYLVISDEEFKDKEKLADAILEQWLDPYYGPRGSAYQLGVLALFKQKWEHLGYTRGDLLKSLSLAPGETVTLEYHNWNKSIIKSEKELSAELEANSSAQLTQRDSKDVIDEMTNTTNFNLDAKANITIPIPNTPVTVGGNAGGATSDQMLTRLNETTNNTVESVKSVSHNFKQSRKIRIEETRDSGMENKQTRVVANNNRCHTLEFRYFEVLANYEITTSLDKLVPCLLVPYTLECDGKIFNQNNIDAKFLLCNEAILKQALMNTKYVAGFEAARKIESYKKLEEMLALEYPASETQQSGNIRSQVDSYESDYEELRDGILEAFNSLENAKKELMTSIFENENKDFFHFIRTYYLTYRKFLAYVALELNTDAMNALLALRGTRASNVPAGRAVRNFFGSVHEADFQFINPVQAKIAVSLKNSGAPPYFADLLSYATYLAPVPLLFGLVGEAVKDDAGLHNSVKMAYVFYTSHSLTPAGKIRTTVTSPNADTNQGCIQEVAPATSRYASLKEIADAHVELDRLICHIQCNFEYYKQALWLSKGMDYHAEFVVESRLGHMVSSEVAGFDGKYVAFPLLPEKINHFKPVFDIKQFVLDYMDGKVNAVSDKISIPTSSTTMQSQLGDCNLCEEYIRDSRIADVRQQNAKAAVDEADAAYKLAQSKIAEQEALRIAARLNANPPDLSDPFVDGSLIMEEPIDPSGTDA